MPSETLWEMDDHTLGKHLVLKSYLDAWFPILASGFSRLVLVDGFAGPGEYAGGEQGSPLVMLGCLCRQLEKVGSPLHGVDVRLRFIEARPDRARHLQGLLSGLVLGPVVPQVVEGRFEESLPDILDPISDSSASSGTPMFVMIDPFGVKGSPMSLIRRVLTRPRGEVFISFMWEPIRRHLDSDAFCAPLEDLFGGTDWLEARVMSSERRKEYLHGLFARRLKDNGAGYVVHFELWDGNRHIYTIFFATGSRKGCDVMKKAIWGATGNGSFRFVGRQPGQLALDVGDGFDAEVLVAKLAKEFGDRWVRVGEVEEFLSSDRTHFHTGQLKQKTLAPLEKQGRLRVNRPSGGWGFPPNAEFRIVPATPSRLDTQSSLF